MSPAAISMLNEYEAQKHVVIELQRQAEALRQQLRYAEAEANAAAVHCSELRSHVLHVLSLGIAAANAESPELTERREYREGPALPVEFAPPAKAPAEVPPAAPANAPTEKAEAEPEAEPASEPPVVATPDEVPDVEVDAWADEACVGDQLPGKADVVVATPPWEPAPVQAQTAAPTPPALSEQDIQRLATWGCDLLRNAQSGSMHHMDWHNFMAKSPVLPAYLTAEQREVAAVRAVTHARKAGLVIFLQEWNGQHVHSRRRWIVEQLVAAVRKSPEPIHKALLLQTLVKDHSVHKVSLFEASQALSAAISARRLHGFGLAVKLGPAENNLDKRITELHGKGLSVNAIAKETGMSWNYVKKILKAA